MAEMCEALTELLGVESAGVVVVEELERIHDVEVLVAEELFAKTLDVLVLLDQQLDETQEHEVFGLALGLLPLASLLSLTLCLFTSFAFFAATLLLSGHIGFEVCALLGGILLCSFASFLFLGVDLLLG